MLMENILKKACGFTPSMVANEMLPGATAVYLTGHLFFAIQGTLLSRSTRSPVTALPQGINIVTFFAFSQLIMVPAYNSAIRDGAEAEVAGRAAYDSGLCACVLLALLELCGLLFVETLRANIPRAAMLSAIAGVSLTYIAMGFAVQVHAISPHLPSLPQPSLTYIAMGFAVQIFAAPGTALVSMLLMLLFYGGQVGISPQISPCSPRISLDLPVISPHLPILSNLLAARPSWFR